MRDALQRVVERVELGADVIRPIDIGRRPHPGGHGAQEGWIEA